MRTATATELKYKILGFNDDQCECDICGKQELKGTYAIENLMTGEIFRAGSSCGAKMARWTVKELVSKYKQGEREKLDAAKKEYTNSYEFLAYHNALDFLDKERCEIERKVWACSTHEGRAQIEATKRNLEDRLNYLRPFNEPMKKRLFEVLNKYNLPTNTYL